MADCKKYIEMISSFADGELSGNDKIELQKHLESCASCRSLLALYTSISEAAAESLVEPPDHFVGSIMEKIKALPEIETAGKSAANKPKKSLKPVVVSFIAAAACLVLAFVVSPELFGLRSARDSTASVPKPAAYGAAESAGGTSTQTTAAQDSAMNATAEDGAPDAAAKASASGDRNGDAEADAGASTQPEIMITEATDMPTPAPSLAPEIAPHMTVKPDEIKAYYAVFIIEGQLPDVLKDYAQTDNGDGTFDIEISAETAEQLIEKGYKAERGAPEAEKALVKYTPSA